VPYYHCLLHVCCVCCLLCCYDTQLFLSFCRTNPTDTDTFSKRTARRSFHGEHGMSDKWYAEESIKVPLIIRGSSCRWHSKARRMNGNSPWTVGAHGIVVTNLKKYRRDAGHWHGTAVMEHESTTNWRLAGTDFSEWTVITMPLGTMLITIFRRLCLDSKGIQVHLLAKTKYEQLYNYAQVTFLRRYTMTFFKMPHLKPKLLLDNNNRYAYLKNMSQMVIPCEEKRNYLQHWYLYSDTNNYNHDGRGLATDMDRSTHWCREVVVVVVDGLSIIEMAH
jgi:hypothetical protein